MARVFRGKSHSVTHCEPVRLNRAEVPMQTNVVADGKQVIETDSHNNNSKSKKSKREYEESRNNSYNDNMASTRTSSALRDEKSERCSSKSAYTTAVQNKPNAP